MYILKHNDSRKGYVAARGPHSYTKKLEYAQVFNTREQAERERCVDSEKVVPLMDMMEYA